MPKFLAGLKPAFFLAGPVRFFEVRPVPVRSPATGFLRPVIPPCRSSSTKIINSSQTKNEAEEELEKMFGFKSGDLSPYRAIDQIDHDSLCKSRKKGRRHALDIFDKTEIKKWWKQERNRRLAVLKKRKEEVSTLMDYNVDSKIDRYSRILFPLSFWIFNIGYITFYLDLKKLYIETENLMRCAAHGSI